MEGGEALAQRNGLVFGMESKLLYQVWFQRLNSQFKLINILLSPVLCTRANTGSIPYVHNLFFQTQIYFDITCRGWHRGLLLPRPTAEK